MLGRIAKLYYEYNYTHQQIADLIGWSRIKVTRALQEARQRGIVHITVLSDEPIFLESEQALCQRFNLQQAWIGPPELEDQSNSNNLTTVGATAIQRLIDPGSQVAVGVSETLAAIAHAIKPAELMPKTTFVPLQGTNPGLVTPPTPSNIAAVFASAYGGRAHALAAPVFTGSLEMLRMLQQDPSVQKAFNFTASSDMALVGVGGTAKRSSIILRADLTEDDAKALRQKGAVGDINARFFDSSGQSIETERTALVLGPSLEEFKQIPIRVAVAAGPLKIAALRGALNGGLITSLITDEPTAQALLQS
ncbi:MAG: helix-turn-helix domain-containing protein [bacterium]|nr:helix-turn-helix domain-containing protein [bacterium]MCY4163214.1 helix-turn-helix domain-containing protein [bacterium]MCY4258247.1 helix-turn-helix domain-containing protein [bacterium]